MRIIQMCCANANREDMEQKRSMIYKHEKDEVYKEKLNIKCVEEFIIKLYKSGE